MTHKKRQKKPTPLDGPLLILQQVLRQCTIPSRTVKLGKEFTTKFDSQAELLTKRLQKITGIRMQPEGLLKGTFGCAIGERETKTLVLEMPWVAKRYDVKVPGAAIA